MAQYISKDALVAEIENLENTYKKCPTRNSYEEGLKDGRLIGYKDALHKINTIEVKEIGVDLGDHKGDKSAKYIIDTKTLKVKEVDLEKEIDDFLAKEWEGIEEDGYFYDMIKNDLSDIAKHFVEIGINLQKDNELTWEDMKLLQDISSEVFAEVAKGNVDYYQIYPTEQLYLEEVLKRFKAQKGE